MTPTEFAEKINADYARFARFVDAVKEAYAEFYHNGWAGPKEPYDHVHDSSGAWDDICNVCKGDHRWAFEDAEEVEPKLRAALAILAEG